MAFALQSYPVVYRARFKDGAWSEEYLERPHKKFAQEAAMTAEERGALEQTRNAYDDMPLVNYTSQYGMGCFEGLKAYPSKREGIYLFRPNKNAARFYQSMRGLYMPPFPEIMFLDACAGVIRRNFALEWYTRYDKDWEKDSYQNAAATYIRPFTISEAGIGVSVSSEPVVMIVCSAVTSYFDPRLKGAMTTTRVRATHRGTGWIKAASNYVISALAKHEAASAGFMECVFLDAVKHDYIEEGSSCNIFFLLKSGKLVTPELSDTILPGITRLSVLDLAKDAGVKTEERKITIEEALDDAQECFVTGTAAGVVPVESLTHGNKTAVYNEGKTGELTAQLRHTLKQIQYGARQDSKGWMYPVV